MTKKNPPLGRQVEGPTGYAPEVLFPVPRDEGRAQLNRESPLPPHGTDIWHAYELSWLLPGGRPVIHTGRFLIPADSPNLVESKSLKLYLNSLNNTEFADQNEAVATITADVSAVAGASIQFELFGPDDAVLAGTNLPGDCLDEEALPHADEPEGLVATGEVVEEQLYTHLVRSLCPVTGQPDWATVWLKYRGPKIARGPLLAYFLSFRGHQEFHEQCVERMYGEIMGACGPESLEIQALYTRRGGLDISPWRSSHPGEAPTYRLNRQ